MKITTVTPFVMWNQDAGRNWLFVKVETDQGVHGWGEGSLVNQTMAIAESVRQISPQVIGQDPARIERLWQIMFLHNRYRGGVVIMSALSAIDQALWDIKGKVLNAPVYQLLGGAVRDKIRTYTHAGDPETVQKRRREGFDAIKTSPWPGRDMDTNERSDVTWLRDHIASIRDAGGPDMDIMVDSHGRTRPKMALKQISAIDDMGLLFFEEPVPPDNVASLELLRGAGLRTDIATGERLLGRWAYRSLIEQQLVDVIQPDVCHTGGISELRRIAAMAEIYHIRLAPHNPKGPVATAANIHLAAATPNFLILEHAWPHPLFDEVQTEPMQLSNSYYGLPTKPGLGVDLDEEAVLSHPHQYRPVLYSEWDDGTPAQT